MIGTHCEKRVESVLRLRAAELWDVRHAIRGGLGAKHVQHPDFDDRRTEEIRPLDRAIEHMDRRVFERCRALLKLPGNTRVAAGLHVLASDSPHLLAIDVRKLRWSVRSHRTARRRRHGERFIADATRSSDATVAIKVLPAALSHDHDRIARFEREAKALAALNHPNIAAIYGLEGQAIVMELVEGPTLEQRIAAGRIPLEDALEIAAQSPTRSRRRMTGASRIAT